MNSAVMILALVAMASAVSWPELPRKGFIAGRTATIEDVKHGDAVFVIETDGRPVGKPMAISVPQYAILVDAESRKEIPVIIIQAEEAASGAQTIGYSEVGTSALGVCLLSDLRLLGTSTP